MITVTSRPVDSFLQLKHFPLNLFPGDCVPFHHQFLLCFGHLIAYCDYSSTQFGSRQLIPRFCLSHLLPESSHLQSCLRLHLNHYSGYRPNLRVSLELLRSTEKVLCAFRSPSLPPPTFGIPSPDKYISFPALQMSNQALCLSACTFVRGVSISFAT
jgi:hypothetical protein